MGIEVNLSETPHAPTTGRRARGDRGGVVYTMAEREATSAVTIEMGSMGVKGDVDDRSMSGDVDEENEPLVASTSGTQGVDANTPETRALPTMAENSRGMVLYALGVVLSSVTALTARLLHRHYDIAVHWIVLGRASAGLCIVSVALRVQTLRGNVPAPLGVRRKVLCLRGIVGTCAVFSFFMTAANLPLADAAVPALVAPLVTVLGAAVWLREKPHWAVYAAFPVCVLGATLVLRPVQGVGAGDLDEGHVHPGTQTKVTMIGVVAAVAQTFFGGISKLLVRVLSGGLGTDGTSHVRKEHPLVLMLYVNCVSVTAMICVAIAFAAAAENNALLVPFVSESEKVEVIGLLTLSTFSGFGAQLSITNALGHASASAVMPVHYTGVFWAVLWGGVIFGEIPGASETVGIAMVMVGSAAASWANLRNKQ